MSFPRGSYCPDNGEIIWLDFDPRLGREQAGRRPGIVLSPRSYNSKVELCIVCPITGQAKGYPFEVALPGNLPITGVVLVDQVKCLSWARRNADFACLAPADVERHVKAKLKALLRL